ncbi:hypothetical protein JIN85_01575 [Luteolibacter pohnpeiensis]|uniref:Uncharacterized protein n=1 Tax=Luteolibacter pohnpeiensis TaxID=454153 RepID=A0A934S7E4_9BACT|nr:hypothetical protein [Luteolibacter pohnpeiensis]MBK1881082.1 hypothetical protein [Luteolibacter pohnpeiensis]
MSQSNEQEDVVVVEETVVETVEVTAEPKKSAPIPLYLVILLFAGAVLMMIFVLNTRKPQVATNQVDKAQVKALKADLEARRVDLNRQREALGLTPISSESESVDEIAARLTKDASTLVALTGSFHHLIAEKDQEISQKSADFMQAEQARQDAMTEISRLQTELQTAQSAADDNRLLLKQVNDLKSQRDELKANLDAANQKLSTYGKDSLTSDQAGDLTRQLNEATRAKSFLEKRVAELEAKLGN